MFGLIALSLIRPALFQMGVIVPFRGLYKFGTKFLPIALFSGGHFVWMSGPVPGFGGPSSGSCFLAFFLRTFLGLRNFGPMFLPIAFFSGGHSVGMSGPVPGFSGGVPSPSSG